MEPITRRNLVKSAAIGAGAMLAASGTSLAVADEATSRAVAESGVTWNALYDLVVVGDGLAGLTASITAATEFGAHVLVLEKAPDGLDGGCSRFCFQCPTFANKGEEEDFLAYLQWLRGTNGPLDNPDDDALRAFVYESANSREWMESLGATTYTFDEVVGESANAYSSYVMYPEYGGNFGFNEFMLSKRWGDGAMFKFLKKTMLANENIDIWYESPATDLIQDPATGTVLGVTASVGGQDVNIRSVKGVVLCCGGYESSSEMLFNFMGLTQAASFDVMYNTGDGITMAMKAGAQMSALYQANTYWSATYNDGATPVWESGTRTGLANNTTSEIWVAGDGNRFSNEIHQSVFGYVPWHAGYHIEYLPMNSWCVFDEPARQDTVFSWNLDTPERFQAALDAGNVITADTLDGLAEQMGVSAENLTATVARFNEFCANGEDVEFHRDPAAMRALAEEGPYYAYRLVQSIVNTMGGPRKNADGAIVDRDFNPIPHLYEAGELGSLFTTTTQGATEAGQCLAFGRISARSAMANDDFVPTDDVVTEPFTYAPAEPEYECGENQVIGMGDGHCGNIVLRFTMDGDVISQCEVLHTFDTPGVGMEASAALAAGVAGMTPEEAASVDTVTHATMTSEGFRAAVCDAFDIDAVDDEAAGSAAADAE